MRIDGRSIDFSKLAEQKGDDIIGHFSFLDLDTPKEQRSCYIAYTSQKVHDILKTGFEKSPLLPAVSRVKALVIARV